MSASLYIDPGVNKHACALYRGGQLAGVYFAEPQGIVGPMIGEWGDVVIEYPRINAQTKGKDPNDQMDLSIEVGDLRACFRIAGARVALVTPSEWKGQLEKPIHHSRIWSVLSPAEREVFARDADQHIKRTKQEKAAVSLVDFIRHKIDHGCEMVARTGKVKEYSWQAHNLLDAVGLGLWHLRRTGRAGRRFPVLAKV